MKKILCAALGLVVLSSTANAGFDRDDRIERQIVSDTNYQANVQKARQILEAKGYQVVDIDADSLRGKKTLEVEAVKGGQEYDIRMAYPSLKIMSERIDD